MLKYRINYIYNFIYLYKNRSDFKPMIFFFLEFFMPLVIPSTLWIQLKWLSVWASGRSNNFMNCFPCRTWNPQSLLVSIHTIQWRPLIHYHIHPCLPLHLYHHNCCAPLTQHQKILGAVYASTSAEKSRSKLCLQMPKDLHLLLCVCLFLNLCLPLLPWRWDPLQPNWKASSQPLINWIPTSCGWVSLSQPRTRKPFLHVCKIWKYSWKAATFLSTS